jgi:hypothetical protein
MPATTATKPLPSEVRKRLGQLMPLLSSTNAGECAAAAGAIGRLLSAHGLDWHDLTAAVANASTASPRPPEPPPRREPPPPPDSHNLAAAEVHSLVLAIRANHHFLNERSKAFLAGQMERAKYGRVLFSDKQWKWLMDLAAQAGVA